METGTTDLISAVEILALGKRKIEKATCQRYHYGITDIGGAKVQVASYRDAEGTVVAQKLRYPGKDFRTIGDSSKIGLWGKDRMQTGGRLVVVTEGEIDCMAVSQAMGNSWPVVSVPHGAVTAKKYLKKEIKWLESFKEVILCFDEDDVGRKAVEDVRSLFTPGRLRIAKLPLKDAGEMVEAGRSDELVRCIWSAPKWTPAGLITGDEILSRVLNRDIRSAGTYPWDGLNELTSGVRYRELVTLVAGSGIGKSTFCRELAASRLNQGETVGYIGLEEGPHQTALGVYGVHANRPLMWEEPRPGDDDLIREAHAEWGERFYLFDHFGCNDTDELLGTIKYLATGLDCRTVILDHISIVISGLEVDDERRAIDATMTRLRKLVEETGILLFLVSHAKRPMGRGHEDGGEISISHLRGSASIAQLSDMVIGMERNQQAEDESDRHRTQVRVLKNRFNGQTGPACALNYVKSTGRLMEHQETPAEDFTVDKNSDF